MKKLSEIIESYRIDRPDEWTMDALKHMSEDLEVERDSLVAKVEQLEKAAIAIRARGNILYGLTVQLMNGSELCGSDWDYISESQVLEIQQCLAEIKAEAGRAGFIAGYHKMHIEFVGSLASSEGAEFAANQYAAKVQQGEKGTWLKDSNVNGGKRQGGE